MMRAQGSMDYAEREAQKAIAYAHPQVECFGNVSQFEQVTEAWWHRQKPGSIDLHTYRRHIARSWLLADRPLPHEVIEQWPQTTGKLHIAPGTSDYYLEGVCKAK